MVRIDPEAVKLLGRGMLEKPGWLRKNSSGALSGCPAHWGESGTLCARAARGTPTRLAAAETQETALVKLGKEVESDFKFI